MNKNRYNRRRNFCHWKLALVRMFQNKLLLIPVLPIILVTIYAWSKMNFLIEYLDVPKLLLPVYTIGLKFLGVSIPLFFVWVLIDFIGTKSSEKDEEMIQKSFRDYECPILMYKCKDKDTKMIIREWYSTIPIEVWIERSKRIEQDMMIRLVSEFRENGKGNRIVMYSTKKGETANIGSFPVYDYNLEKDMESID